MQEFTTAVRNQLIAIRWTLTGTACWRGEGLVEILDIAVTIPLPMGWTVQFYPEGEEGFLPDYLHAEVRDHFGRPVLPTDDQHDYAVTAGRSVLRRFAADEGEESGPVGGPHLASYIEEMLEVEIV